MYWQDSGERYANVSCRFAAITNDIATKDKDFVRFRFHDLGHLHAVEWLRSGRSIYSLQQRTAAFSHSATSPCRNSLPITEIQANHALRPGLEPHFRQR